MAAKANGTTVAAAQCCVCETGAPGDLAAAGWYVLQLRREHCYRPAGAGGDAVHLPATSWFLVCDECGPLVRYRKYDRAVRRRRDLAQLVAVKGGKVGIELAIELHEAARGLCALHKAARLVRYRWWRQ